MVQVQVQVQLQVQVQVQVRVRVRVRVRVPAQVQAQVQVQVQVVRLSKTWQRLMALARPLLVQPGGAVPPSFDAAGNRQGRHHAAPWLG